MILFFYILVAGIFLLPASAAVFYIVAGIGRIKTGIKESNEVLIRSGRITCMNSLVALMLICFFGFVTYRILLG